MRTFVAPLEEPILNTDLLIKRIMQTQEDWLIDVIEDLECVYDNSQVEIYAIWGGVPEHTDSEIPDPTVYGCVLVNPGVVLKTRDGVFDIPAGTRYCLESQQPHSAMAPDNKQAEGLFVFAVFKGPGALSHHDLQEAVDDYIKNG